MNIPPANEGFDIISTIRSDGILYSSEANTMINAHMGSTRSIQFYMLSYHQERMLVSARAFGWNTDALEGFDGWNRLLHLLHDHLLLKYKVWDYGAPLMLRIAFSADGSLSVTSNGPHPLPATIDRLLPSMNSASQLYPKSLSDIVQSFPNLEDLRPYLRWCVYISDETRIPSLFTCHKTSSRSDYDKAYSNIHSYPAPVLYHGVQLQIEILIANDCREIMEGCRFTPYFWREGKWITPARHCGGNLGTTRRWALTMGLCEVGMVLVGSIKCNEIIVLSNGAKGFQAGIVRPWPISLSL